MKSRRSYISLVLLVQMLVLPILITIGSAFVSMILSELIRTTAFTDRHSDLMKLLNISIALLGPLLLGTAIGYVFSKKTKLEEGRDKSLSPLFPIVYALSFAIIAYVFSKGNYNSGLWGIYALKNPTFLFFDFVVAISGLNYVIPITEISAYCGFSAGILLQEKVSKTNVKGKAASQFKLSYAALCSIFLVSTYLANKDIIENGIFELLNGNETIGKELTEFDLMNIAPFRENNGLAKLDKAASLQFTDFNDMPRLDGATAAYPVYASFVQEVYKGLGDYYAANKDSTEKDFYFAFVNNSSFPLNIIQCTKTNQAYERLINGETDIIFVAEPSKDHINRIKEKGDDFELTPIGSEAFVFFTNIKNPVDSLTIEEIQKIYSGEITSWKEVGGLKHNILPYQRPQNSGSQTIMENKVMKDIKMIAPTERTFAGGMGGIIREVASYKNAKSAIGYSFMYYSSKMIKNNQIKYIGVNGIKPTKETVRNKSYPFTVPVYAVTLKSNKKENVTKFIDWILSDEGQSLIEKTGYVPAKSIKN